MIAVDLPGLVLTNEPGQQVAFLVDVDGWSDSPVPRDLGDERSTSDGDFDEGPTQWRARHITVVGQLIAPGNLDAVDDLHEQVMSIFALRNQFEFGYTNRRGRLTAMVRPSGRFDYPIEDENGVASFTIPLVAADPLKYGPRVPIPPIYLPILGGGMVFAAPAGSNGAFDFGANGTTGRATLTNEGTADVWPTYVVTGQLTDGFTIQCLETGQYLRYDRPVPVGSTVTIDSKTWEVLIDGASPWTLTRDDYFSIPAKGSRTIQFNAISSGDANAHLDVFMAPGNL